MQARDDRTPTVRHYQLEITFHTGETYTYAGKRFGRAGHLREGTVLEFRHWCEALAVERTRRQKYSADVADYPEVRLRDNEGNLLLSWGDEPAEVSGAVQEEMSFDAE